MANEQLVFYQQTARLAEECGSLYRDIQPCRNDLLGFMDANEWFGQNVSGSGYEICIENMEAIRDRLLLWLRAYRRSAGEKTDILLEAAQVRFPETCRLYRDFLARQGVYGEMGSLRVLDFLLSSIDRDILLYSEDELQAVLRDMGEYLSISNRKILFDFLSSLSKEGLRLSYNYDVQSRSTHRDTSAYPLEDFARLAYWTFHPDSWEERQLLEKAAASVQNAGVWLYVALHFVCAWRKSDIARLPLPDLPYSGEEIRRRILDRTYQNTEARALVSQWLFSVDLQAMKPSKTARHGGTPTLKLFIPESLEEPFGMILALAASHKLSAGECVPVRCDVPLLRRFFGEDFATVAGKRKFLNRRANKALLQGIDTLSGNIPGRPAGYMLAALARSHKGGIGELPAITDIYLRDENFTGYKPEFILREMFERGIFGFVPALLLDACVGSQYRKLPVPSQTELIRLIGLTPLQIETITSAVGYALRRAEQAVRETFCAVGETKEGISILLQKIASASVPAKQTDMLCLRMAAGMTCNRHDRSCCAGCGYEIYTKAALQVLMREYVELSWQCSQAEGWQKERIRKLLEAGILAPVSEMIHSIPMLYPNADMTPMLEIVERGLERAANPDG